MEHFGTLNSSLRLLEQVRPHYVKIDGSLIRGLGYNRVHQSKVTSITEKAKHYDCQTVAEFVEEATSLPVLWKCGVNFVQGHFLQEAAEEGYDTTDLVFKVVPSSFSEQEVNISFVKDGEVIIKQGDEGDCLYVIQQGKVEVIDESNEKELKL